MTGAPIECEHIRCGHIAEEDCSQACDDEDQAWDERHELDDDEYERAVVDVPVGNVL